MDDSSFLRAILEDPASDHPRLVYADRLDERGDPHGEFIRVQCELDRRYPDWFGEPGAWRPYAKLLRREQELIPRAWWAWCCPDFLQGRQWSVCRDQSDITVYAAAGPPEVELTCRIRRGLVASVTLTAAKFLGGPCERCRGSGRSRNQYGEDTGFKCIVCRGTGRVEGLAAALFRAAPITEVRLSDKHPSNSTQYPSLFGWLPEAPELSALRQLNPAEFLPYEVWDLLDAISPEVILTHYRPLDTGHWKWFASERDALVGLSAACVAYGRSLTHPPLPPLTGAPATESKR